MSPILTAVLAAFFAAPAAAQQDREVVRVNGTPIRQSEILERLWKRFGTDTLEEMVDELLLRQAAQTQKVKASPAEVDKRLARLKAQFPDPTLYAQQLANASTTEAQLKEDLADQIARDKLVIAQKNLAIKEAELREAFSAHKDELGVREAVHLRHILTDSKAEAEKIAAQVKSGGDFKLIAREKSLAPTGKLNGGDYGFVSKGMLPAEIEQIAFGLKPGELRVTASGKGFHVLQAVARRSAAPAEFDKVKDDLRDALMQEKLKPAISEFLRELRSKAEIKPGA